MSCRDIGPCGIVGITEPDDPGAASDAGKDPIKVYLQVIHRNPHACPPHDRDTDGVLDKTQLGHDGLITFIDIGSADRWDHLLKPVRGHDRCC